jgi:hypothetical protein
MVRRGGLKIFVCAWNNLRFTFGAIASNHRTITTMYEIGTAEEKLNRMLQGSRSTVRTHEKKLIGKRLRRFLIGLCVLVTIYLIAASFEASAVCRQYQDFYFISEHMPFSSEAESLTGYIVLDLILWIWAVIRTIVFHTLFVWPLLLTFFLVCSENVSVKWKTTDWASKQFGKLGERSSPSPDIAQHGPEIEEGAAGDRKYMH